MYTQEKLMNVNLSSAEIDILIEMYYDRIEELEDLNTINVFENWKYNIATDNEAKAVFNKLLAKNYA